MSVKRVEVASVQFQIESRQANASMRALEEEAKELNGKITEVQKNIEGLGNVPKDNPQLLAFQNQSKQLKRDLDDVNKTIKDYTRGVKAADELLRNYDRGTIETMSMKAIKAGQNGLKKRIDNIDPNKADAKELEAYRIITEVIRESQRVVDDFKVDAEKTIQTIKDGGVVSAKTLRQTRDGLRDLKEGVAEGTKEWQNYQRQLTTVSDKLQALGVEEMRRTGKQTLGRAFRGDFATADVKTLNETIAKLREYQGVIQDPEGKGARIFAAAELQIRNLSESLARLKNEGSLRLMTDRLGSLSTLSKDALTETKKFWQAMYDGAERSSQAFKDAEDAMKRINEQENVRKAGQATRVLSNPQNYGDAEIRQAVQAMEQLRDAQAHGSQQWELYNKRVEEGRKYLQEWSQVDSIIKFEGQMQKLPTLSDAALQETKKFWETMVAGAEKGSQELAQYEAHLENVKREEQERRQLNDEITAQRLNGNLNNQSEKEINEAIEAAKRLIQTYETASPEAEALAKKIADAEEHVKKYGLEAERAARREAQAIADASKKRQEADDIMRQQLQQGSNLSKEALKNQENYWKKLIDDPKTAATSLQDYQQQLDKVRLLQQMMMQQEGSDALDFFRGDTKNASAEEIKRQAAALKLFRDSLPEKDNADLIKEIDGYLQQAGASAKKAAADAMTFKQALQVGKTAGTGSFKGTVEQLTQAKKVLEDMSAKAVKGGLAWRRMQEALQRINIELKNVGHISQEVQKVLDNPKGRSFNQLKQAVEQGRIALNAMDRSTKEGQKAFDELAKKIKACDLEMKTLGNSAKGTVSAFDKAWSRLKTYVGLYVGAAVAMQKVTATAGDLLELSDKMGEVRKTTGFTADEVGRLTTELKKLDTRTALTGLMELSSLAGSIGLKTQEQVEGFTEAANMLTVSLPEMGNEASRTLMKIADATGDLEKNGGNVRETLERVGSTIIALRANSAAAAGPITDFVSRVGAVGAQAGISIDQIAALGATVDALGGRVEMSATALSRMIPAIKNNSFAVAQAIGMTEKELKGMTGMEQMVAIFRRLHDSVKDFDMTTEEGMNAAADAVEQMMGKSASMQEVMKTLNQQGARAGIVFGLLSQNVDMLEKQLGIAGEAYQKNTALLDEYNKMNDTTAAKWERLKNQLEEFFVGDQAQRMLGGIIDGLRWIIDALTGNNGVSAAIRSIITFLVLTKINIYSIITSVGAWRVGLQQVGIAIGFVDKATKKLQWGNIFTAAAGAVLLLIEALSSLKGKTDAVSESFMELTSRMSEATNEANSLFDRFKKLGNRQTELAYNTKELKKREEELKKELDELRKKLGDGAEKTEEFTKKQKELEEAHKEVAKAENEASKATGERLGLIKEINSKYGEYLGYMLSEASTAESVASAHDLIIAALKEEMYWREKNNAYKTITEKHQEQLNDYIKDSLDELEDIAADPARQQKIMSAWQAELAKVTYDANAGGFTLTPGGKAYDTIDKALDAMKERFNSVLVTNDGYYMVHTDDKEDRLNNWWGGGSDNGFKDWTEEQLKILKETSMLENMSGSAAASAHQATLRQAESRIDVLLNDASKRGEGVTNKQLAEAIVGISKTYEKYSDLNGYLGNGRYIEASERNANSLVNILLSDLPEETRKAVQEEVAKIPLSGGNTTNTIKPTNPYGDYNKVTDEYSKWSGNDLVARRKEMLERVKALANGADVQSVLSEDAKFISEAVRKNIKTTEQAIEWYNQERLKIQDALYNKHLTPTGDWLDPKKGGTNWRRQLQTDFDSYLKILDAYYTERKARIQQAQTEEGMSEAEAQRLTIENETVWRKHRMELQQIYQGKGEKIAKEERQRIYDILAEQDEDSADMVEKTIQKSLDKMKLLATKSEVDYNKIMSKLTKDIATDLFKQQDAVAKQVEAIRSIIAKERPFNGLTENLEKNLSTMGILFADLDKIRREAIEKGLEPEDDTSKRGMEQTTKRMLLLLKEAENAYSLTWEQLKEKMQQEGLGDWAAALEVDEQKKQAVIASLHSFYDSVQDAIKKEASQIKKQTDIIWNDAIIPGADGQNMSMKGVFDKAISQLGLQESRVSRANSLIGAGQASERVADKLAIQQLKVKVAMQQAYYDLIKKKGADHIAKLEKEAELLEKQGLLDEAAIKRLDVKHAKTALALSDAEEQTKIMELQNSLAEKAEESQNRLYTELKEWGDLLASSLQSIFEASAAGNEEYYNELAKLNLTGKGGPGAGTYVVIDDAGTEDATAHYEYLDERQALERQHEIEQENAKAEAWKKVMDELNEKMNDSITDWMNAYLQNQAIDANTTALNTLTGAVNNLAGVMGGQPTGDYARNAEGMDVDASGNVVYPVQPTAPATEQPAEGGAPVSYWPMSEEHKEQIAGWNNELWQRYGEAGIETMQTMSDATAGMPSVVTNPYPASEEQVERIGEMQDTLNQKAIDNSNKKTQVIIDNANKEAAATQNASKKEAASTQSAFAKMTAAANMYGIAYQAMANDNLSTSQKFQMMAVQAAGQAAISMLTTDLATSEGKTAAQLPGILGQCIEAAGPYAGPILFAVISGVLGGLLGVAVSKIAKSKSTIAQATGSSASAGKLATGMLTYAEGNVNEFTNPDTLTPGRQYNVDAADGRTYIARYMGSNPRTHITNGPEFHLAGEAGREMIIDAGTTRQITMNEGEIWHAIQTLSNGGYSRRRNVGHGGMRAFKDGNVDDFDFTTEGAEGTDGTGMNGMTADQMLAFQASLDRNSAIMERLAEEGIEAFVSPYGKRGIVNGYDHYKKEAQRQGVKY